MMHMNKFQKYVVIQLKRACKSLPIALAISLFLLLGFSIVFAGVIEQEESSAKKQKIQIGIVGNLEDNYLQLGMRALQNFDSTRFSISLLPMELEEAKRKMIGGELTCYLILPDNFIDSVNYGRNDKITVVSANGTTNFGTIVMQELALDISDLVLCSQNGIYGMQRYLTEHDLLEDWNELTDDLNLRYIFALLKRTDLFEVEQLGVSNHVSYIGYYFCAFLVFFLMIWGIVCAPSFIQKDLRLFRLLSSRGYSTKIQVLGNFISYLLCMLSCMIGVYLSILIVFEKFGYKISEICNRTQLFVFLGKTIPIIIMLATFQLFLYEIGKNIFSSIILQFVGNIVLCYISGCFYPINFLPENMIQVSRYLPTGVALRYLNAIILQERMEHELIYIGILSIALIGVTMWIHKETLERW